MPKKFFITTAIPYVNSTPHVGHALELIQADVLARYHRQLGEPVFFLNGTDENALKNVQAAERASEEIGSFVTRHAEEFRKLSKVFNISNDDFIRTSDQQKHWPAVIKMWQQLAKNGDLFKEFRQNIRHLEILICGMVSCACGCIRTNHPVSLATTTKRLELL